MLQHPPPPPWLLGCLQAYPFVVRKVLRNESGSAALLRELLYDPGTGAVRATRLSTLMNAALGEF